MTKKQATPPPVPRRRVRISPARVGWWIDAGLTSKMWALTFRGAVRVSDRWGGVTDVAWPTQRRRLNP